MGLATAVVTAASDYSQRVQADRVALASGRARGLGSIYERLGFCRVHRSGAVLILELSGPPGRTKAVGEVRPRSFFLGPDDAGFLGGLLSRPHWIVTNSRLERGLVADPEYVLSDLIARHASLGVGSIHKDRRAGNWRSWLVTDEDGATQLRLGPICTAAHPDPPGRVHITNWIADAERFRADGAYRYRPPRTAPSAR